MIGVRDVPAGVEVGVVAHAPLGSSKPFLWWYYGLLFSLVVGGEGGFYRQLLPCAELGFCVLVDDGM